MCCLGAGRFSVAKIGSCFRTEEKISDQQENQTMNHHFLQRIEEADPHVERDPSQRKPTRPVVASQQKCPTDNCNKFSEFDQKIAIVKRMPRQDLAEVVNKTDSPDTDINAGKDCYREGTFVHRREISSTSVSIRLCYKATVPGSFENFSDEPYVSERVQHSALQHPSDRTRPGRGVRVFLYWTVLGSSGGQGSHMDRSGVLHE